MKYCLESIFDKNINYTCFRALQIIINTEQINNSLYKKIKKSCEKLCELGYVYLKRGYFDYSNPEPILSPTLTLVEVDEVFKNNITIEKLVSKIEDLVNFTYLNLEEPYVADDRITYEKEIEYYSTLRMYIIIKALNKNNTYKETYKYINTNTGMTGITIERSIENLEYFNIVNSENSNLKFKIGYNRKKNMKSIKELLNESVVELEFDYSPFMADITILPKDVINIPKNKKGCYIMHNKEKDIIYIGKSKDLKARVSSHIHGLTHTKEFSAEIEYISLILIDEDKYEECSDFFEKDLIKTLSPKYNRIYNVA